MRSLTAALFAVLGILSTQAEIITARSPCLPATLQPTDEADIDATIDRADQPPVQVGIYKDFDLRGSIYGDTPVATYTVDPQPRAAGVQPDNDSQPKQALACP